MTEQKTKKRGKQAGAELCQAQHSLSLDLYTNWRGLITQPAVAGARKLAELQLRINWHKGAGAKSKPSQDKLSKP